MPSTVQPDMSSEELSRLLSLINVPPSKQQLPSMSFEGAATRLAFDINGADPSGAHGLHPGAPRQPTITLPGSGACQQQSTEAYALEQFSLKYKTTRDFSHTDKGDQLKLIFKALIKQRLQQRLWRERAPPENILRTLGVLRIFMRDEQYQRLFLELEGVAELSEALRIGAASQQKHGDATLIIDILKEITTIFQKLLANHNLKERIGKYNIHETMVLLLAQNIPDVIVLRCTLCALTDLSESASVRAQIVRLDCLDHILNILNLQGGYDTQTKILAAKLLRILSEEQPMRENLKVYDGIRVLINMLHTGKNLKVLCSVAWTLVHLAKDQDTRDDLRGLGVIPLLLSLVGGNKLEGSESAGIPSAGAGEGGHMSAGSAEGGVRRHTSAAGQTPDEVTMEAKIDYYALKSGCCAALTELVMCDHNSQQLVQQNGVYTLSRLLLPRFTGTETDGERKELETLQRNALRTLRFLFSMEKNRRLLRKVFPAGIFEKFIDVGHYVKDISAYKLVADSINTLPEDTLAEVRDNIEATNKRREATHHVKGDEYAVLEHIGSGAFGSVYRVKEKGSQNHKAMKEVNLNQCTAAKTSKDRDKSIGEIVSEIKMVQEELRHPNIVRYHRTFTENDKLYIVMELIEGAPIGEYCISLKEKKDRFTESRIWHIFIQMVLALRYLHKDKGIVHRDLSPNNIMLGEMDKVTITDFGLAKQKDKENSQLKSAVGTLLYSCPEIVQNLPYGEKADIWAAGCILYQMCMLQPPFRSTNMLALANRIVNAEYEPITPELYSDRMREIVRKCITVDPGDRPDIEGVAGIMADKLILYIENMRKQERQLQRKLEKERHHTQRQNTATEASRRQYMHTSAESQYSMNHGQQRRYSEQLSDGMLPGPSPASAYTDGMPCAGVGSSFSEGDSSLNSNGGISHNSENFPRRGLILGQACRKLDMDSVASQSTNQQREFPRVTNGNRGQWGGPRGSVNGEEPMFSITEVNRMADNVFEKQYKDGNNNGVWTSEEESSGDSRESSGSSTSLKAMAHREALAHRQAGDGATFCRPAPPRHPKKKDYTARRNPRITEQLQLNLVPHHQRDSSVSSCDPSPGNQLYIPRVSSGDPQRRASPGSAGLRGAHILMDSHLKRSTSSPQLVESRRAASGGKSRPSSSGTPTLSISPRKVRQISDPIQQLLTVVHKIIYISQLPPSVHPQPKRRLVTRFKKALFDANSNTHQLKAELRKLVESSPDIVSDFSGIGLPSGDERGGGRTTPTAHGRSKGQREADKMSLGSAGRALSRQTSLEHDGALEESYSSITYEDMARIIEELLAENDYNSAIKMNPGYAPLGPIVRGS